MSAILPPEHSFKLPLNVTVLLNYSSLILALGEEFVVLFWTTNFKNLFRHIVSAGGIRIIRTMKVSVSWKGHKVYILATVPVYPRLATLT